MTHSSVGVIVLAAGAASRYGAPKLALPIDGVPMVRRAALAALAVSRHVVVVTGAHCERIEPLLGDLAVNVAYNPDWEQGMSQSIAYGIMRLCAVAPDVAGALVMLPDQVRVGAAELCRLLQAHAATPQLLIAANYAGECGAPCVFPRAYFDRLMHLQGARGARAVLRRHAQSVHALDMPQAEIDIDTPEDYLRLIKASAAR